MRRIDPVVMPVALALALAACGSRPDMPPGPPPMRMFFSPAGEPFRPIQGGAPPIDQWRAKADANGDGAIDRAELIKDFARFFVVLDIDKDGWVQGAEITRYEQTIAPEILSGGGPPQAGPTSSARGRRGDGPRQGAAQFGLLNDAQPVMSADFDLNHRVSAAEFERKAADAFRRLDLNGDGKLTADELQPPAPPRGGPGGGGRGQGGGGRGGPPGGGGRGGPPGGGMGGMGGMGGGPF